MKSRPASVGDKGAAERITSEFPLAAAGLITTEVIPLHPLKF